MHARPPRCHTCRVSPPAHRTHHTLEDYLNFEAHTDAKHEYLDGQIYAMSGGTPEHAALASTIGSLLFPQLRNGPFRSYSSHLRVRVPASGLDTYPDLTVVCGPPIPDAKDKLAANNPTLLVEVLSPSTEEYDRTDKFEHYRTLESLQQYLLVDPRARAVEVRTRGADGAWVAATCVEGQVAELGSIGARLDVGELFASAG
jgi:Uma2 family endonuclease